MLFCTLQHNTVPLTFKILTFQSVQIVWEPMSNNMYVRSYVCTVEPLNKGHFGISHFVLCWEVVPSFLGGSFIGGFTVRMYVIPLDTNLRAFCTSIPATTAMVVGKDAAHTPSLFRVFSSIPDATTSGGAHCAQKWSQSFSLLNVTQGILHH